MPVPDHPLFARLRSLAADGPLVVAHRGDSSHFAENTIDAFRAAVLGQPINYAAWGVSTIVAALTLVIGLVWFAKLERKFADVV